MDIKKGNDNLNPTAEKDRNLGLIGTIFLWTAATLVTPTIMTGQMFIPDIAPYSAIMMVILGSILGSIALASVAIIGTKTGLSTFVIVRSTYGYHGSKIFAGLNVIILSGWALIQGYLGSIALNKVITFIFGFDNVVLCIFITQCLVMVITILGHSGIQKIEGIASSLMLIMAFIVTYKLMNEHGLTDIKELPLSDNPSFTIAVVFDIVLATAFSWITLPCDYNRYCKSKKISAGGLIGGYLLGTIIAMGLGILVGTFSLKSGHTSTYDPADIMQGKYVIFGSLVMFLSVVTTNIMGLYSISMSSMSVLPKLKFSTVVIFWGLLTTFGTLLQDKLLASFFDWVLLVGALMIPVFSIVITDYYFIKKGKLNLKSIEFHHGNKIDFNKSAIITYFLSAIFAIFFTYIEPLSIGSTAITFIFSSLIYFIINKIISYKKYNNITELQSQIK